MRSGLSNMARSPRSDSGQRSRRPPFARRTRGIVTFARDGCRGRHRIERGGAGSVFYTLRSSGRRGDGGAHNEARCRFRYHSDTIEGKYERRSRGLSRGAPHPRGRARVAQVERSIGPDPPRPGSGDPGFPQTRAVGAAAEVLPLAAPVRFSHYVSAPRSQVERNDMIENHPKSFPAVVGVVRRSGFFPGGEPHDPPAAVFSSPLQAAE